MENCLFCKIINGEIPANIVYKNDDVIAFKDINPQAPVHILVVPKKHIQCAADAEASDGKMLSSVFSAIAQIAKDNKLDKGFRIINNCGPDGGQTVPHLHFHILGGKSLGDRVV
jgi:histidine triad (HIT) family protein